MKKNYKTPEEYLESFEGNLKEIAINLRSLLLNRLPKGFKEEISYGMIGYVIPHSIYPEGYHVNPKLPLPFINLAVQKNNVSLYHMGLYGNKEILHWFLEEFSQRYDFKLDMGKSCLRFKKMEKVPFELLGELFEKITVDDYLTSYKKALKK